MNRSQSLYIVRYSTIIFGFIALSVCLCSSFTLAGQSLKWPLDSKPALTGTFCEFRPGHFHSGLDMKVYGKVGLKCFAVSDGWVSRIKVSPSGYGRALYLKLRDGRTAVYAHLSRFAPKLEKLIRETQEETRQFELELFFESDTLFPFKKGDVVAYSGRSGTKHPHLHFEVRDSLERPLNPLLEGIKIADHISPVPVALAVIPLDGRSTVEGDCQPRLYKHLVEQTTGVYSPGDPIGVTGRIGISIDAYDRADASNNLLAVHQIELKVDGKTKWVTRFDRFDFAETRQLEVERDYRLMRRRQGVFHRLYRAPGNTLEWVEGDGTIETAEDESFSIDVEIILSDAHGNRKSVQLILVSDQVYPHDRGISGEPLIQSSWNRGSIGVDQFDGYLRLSAPFGVSGFQLRGNFNVSPIARSFPFGLAARQVDFGVSAAWIFDDLVIDNTPVIIATLDRMGIPIQNKEVVFFQAFPDVASEIKLDNGLLILEIPPNTVTTDRFIRVIPQPDLDVQGWIESTYKIDPQDQPLGGKITVMIARDGMNEFEPGWGMYYLDEKEGWTFLGNEFRDGFYAGVALSLETFGLVRDIDAPEVKVRTPLDGQEFTSSQPQFEIFIKDEISDMVASGLTLKIDGNVVPAEYDPARDRLIYMPYKPLSGGSHRLQVNAVDRVGNIAEKSVTFTIKR